MRVYAVLDEHGALLDTRDTLMQATELAYSESPNVTICASSDVDEDSQVTLGTDLAGALRQNRTARLQPNWPELAWRLSTLPRVTRQEIDAVSSDEAWDRVCRYMPAGWRAWRQAKSRSAGLLSSNTKLGKDSTAALAAGGVRVPYVVETQGLGLAPASRAWEFSNHGVPILKKQRSTLCLGSSPECRASCLSATGNNTTGAFEDWDKQPIPRVTPDGTQLRIAAYRIYNYGIKVRKTQALLADPVAFLRAFIDAVQYRLDRTPKDTQLYIRLNILSDIPWELVCPDLFTHYFPQVQFYDYTKIPFRGHSGNWLPDNYHLTFSYSGHNYDHCVAERDAGRSVAVVMTTGKFDRVNCYTDAMFTPLIEQINQNKERAYAKEQQAYAKALRSAKKTPGAKTPKRPARPAFYTPIPVSSLWGWGLPTISGDLYDARPLDPQLFSAAGSTHGIISLRFKAAARLTDSDSVTVQVDEVERFVVRGEWDEQNNVLILPQTPSSAGACGSDAEEAAGPLVRGNGFFSRDYCLEMDGEEAWGVGEVAHIRESAAAVGLKVKQASPTQIKVCGTDSLALDRFARYLYEE